jgi:plastocyanin
VSQKLDTTGLRLERRAPVVLLALALAVPLLLIGCGGDDDNKESETANSSSSTQAGNKHGTEDVSGKPSADVELDDFYFEPTVLEGEPGQSVSLKLENAGNVEHNFSLSKQGIDQDVEKGQSTTVKVTFPKSGTLRFVCKYHEAQGMTGSLSVSGSASDGTTSSSGDGGGGGY